MPRKPTMIGAHLPKVSTPRRSGLYAAAREFNQAFAKWTRRTGRTHLTPAPRFFKR